MSKKSRKRNRRLLKAAALIGGLAMMGRGRGTGVSGSDKAKFTSDAAYSIPGGDESSFKVQDVKVNVPSKKPVVNLSRMTGHGDQGGLTGQKKRSDYVRRARDAARANAMRALRSNEAYRGNIMTAPSTGTIFEDSGVPNMYQSARKGGRIVKGKKTAVRTGAAKRGFGRAYKGGKK